MEYEPTNVLAAFEILFEEVEGEIENVNAAGATAFKSGNYTRVEEMRVVAEKLTGFRERAVNFRREWQTLAAEFGPALDEDSAIRAKRRALGKLERGMRTPEDAYRLPILESLIELGGSARTADVMERVKVKMADQLKAVDFESPPSNPSVERWYSTGQWARNSMIQEGLMEDSSPHGVWEISEAGRRHLADATTTLSPQLASDDHSTSSTLAATTFKRMTVTEQDVERAIQAFDAQYPADTNAYDSWLEKNSYKWALRYNDKLYPHKYVLGLATELDTTSFTASEARRALGKLGYEIIRKP